MAFYAGVRLASWALSRAARRYARARGLPAARGSREAPAIFYRRQKLPWFAPPPEAFPIAWSINSAGLIAAGLRALNLPRTRPGRCAFLALQAAGWGLFASFDAAYIELRSRRNAAGVTLPYAALIWASLRLALKPLRDRRLAWELAPVSAWMLLAVPLSLAQARRPELLPRGDAPEPGAAAPGPAPDNRGRE